MRPTEGEAQPRTVAALAAPLYLIHTTKSPNPRPARVSSRFDFVEGLSLGDLIQAQKQGPFFVLDLLNRRSDGKSKT